MTCSHQTVARGDHGYRCSHCGAAMLVLAKLPMSPTVAAIEARFQAKIDAAIVGFADRIRAAEQAPPRCPYCEGADYGCPTHACEVCAKSSSQRPHSPGCPCAADLAGLAAHDQ